MTTIDVDRLRDCMRDYCGSAMMSGLPAAFIDVVDIEHASGKELCSMAERMGIDLGGFIIEE